MYLYNERKTIWSVGFVKIRKETRRKSFRKRGGNSKQNGKREVFWMDLEGKNRRRNFRKEEWSVEWKKGGLEWERNMGF